MPSIQYLQKYIRERDHHPEKIKDYFIKLTEEVGELGAALRHGSRMQGDEIKGTIDEEIWDVIYYALAIANCAEVNLDRAIELKEEINNRKYHHDEPYRPD